MLLGSGRLLPPPVSHNPSVVIVVAITKVKAPRGMRPRCHCFRRLIDVGYKYRRFVKELGWPKLLFLAQTSQLLYRPFGESSTWPRSFIDHAPLPDALNMTHKLRGFNDENPVKCSTSLRSMILSMAFADHFAGRILVKHGI